MRTKALITAENIEDIRITLIVTFGKCEQLEVGAYVYSDLISRNSRVSRRVINSYETIGWIDLKRKFENTR